MMQANRPSSSVHTVHFYAASNGNRFIHEIAEQFAEGFDLMGIDTAIIYDRVPRRTANTLNCIIGPHEFYELFLSRVSVPEQCQALADCHIINTEQPGSSWFFNVVAIALKCAAVSDISLNGVRGFRDVGIVADYTPLGVAGLPPRDEEWLSSHRRDIDVLFMGYASVRRESFFADSIDAFAGLSAEIRLVPLDEPRRVETPNTLFGTDRSRRIERTKVLLNIHGGDNSYFEWQRFILAASSGAVLVSEKSSAHGPVQNHEHAIFCDLPEIPAVCSELANASDTRISIAENAYTLLRESFDIRASCAALLRNTRVGVRKQNTPLAVLRSVRSAARATAHRLVYRRCAALYAAACARWDATQVAVRGRQGDSVNERRRDCLNRIDARLESPDPWSTKWMHTQRFGSRSVDTTPTISVLVTLYNYGSVIEKCISSVNAEHTFSPELPIELIVVDDCSTDNSAAQAERTLGAVAVPSMLVRKATNTGLADARNVALHFACGEYVFILDADNWLLPRGLTWLHKAAGDEVADAAYGIIGCVGFQRSKRARLLSQFGWDVRRLVQRPYIDAMALFRRESLSALGGYDTQLLHHGWFGWEDYDLWLRHAAHGKRVAFTPHFVAGYRVHDRSMINTTNIYAAALSEYLEKKYPLLSPPVGECGGYRFGRWVHRENKPSKLC